MQAHDDGDLLTSAGADSGTGSIFSWDVSARPGGSIYSGTSTTQFHDDDRSPGLSSHTSSLPPAILQNWTRLALSDLSVSSYLRISRLSKKDDGWKGAGSRRLTGSSLRYFIEFWKVVNENAVEPEFTLAPNGRLHVEWHKSWRKHLDIQFDEKGLAHYGLFEGENVHEGTDSIVELSDMLLRRHSQPLKWQA